MQWKQTVPDEQPTPTPPRCIWMFYLLYAYVYDRACTLYLSARVGAYQPVFAVSVYMDACMFVKPYMHECASQSVCASATVSTPLGLSTKPAQRQMGNFLRGKGGGGGSGAAAKAAGCFPLLLKSDRVKDTALRRYLQTARRKIEETVWQNKSRRKTFSLVFLLLSLPSASAFEESAAHYLFIVSW